MSRGSKLLCQNVSTLSELWRVERGWLTVPVREAFRIFGFPIAKSKSPILHHAAYDYHKLPHSFTLAESETLVPEWTEGIIRAPDFGGAAVTMPHKMEIMKYIDEITPTAKLLGAVNTLIPVKDSVTGKTKLVGDNTDHVGIANCLRASLLPSHNFEPNKSTGLVVGAGGAGRAAVYALNQLGCSTIYLFNRTLSTAQTVATSFPPSFNIVIIPSLEESSFTAGLPALIVGTLPSTATSTHLVPPSDDKSTLYLDAGCFNRPEGGAMVEMAYLPRRTPFVQLAEESGKDWRISTGIYVLLQQGYAQFEIWNGVKAPQKEVAEAVLKAYDAENPVTKV
ncbi:Pentafunctional AROM polypeptide [Pseudohyphozyma bogoriensis]|nr:Pentafunctional AROM polypeptide [Pseudohyphozyma bogoriensis]